MPFLDSVRTMSFVVTPEDGRRLQGRFEVVIKIRGEQTGGAMAVIAEVLPPGAFISAHTHANDVWVHVLEGEVGALVGEDIEHAVAGSWVLKPRDVVHAMWNRGDAPAKIIEVLTPAGSERWFEELAALQPNDEAGWRASCERYGIRFLDSPRNAEIRARYGLDGA